MSRVFFNLMKSDAGFNYRWVQPPQITYLVSTVDRWGNHNITPVTLGTCVGVNSLSDPQESNYTYAFSVGSMDVPDIPARDAFRNLEAVPECVISYPGSELMEQIWVTALPFPPGIEEVEVARLTPLPSRAVRPAGIAECPVNIEARVRSSCAVGDHFRLYVCQAVGVSVDRGLLEQDEKNPLHYGILAIDPLFEVAIVPKRDLPPRLYFSRLDREALIRTPDDIGSSKKWVGSFEDWIEDESHRGKVTDDERQEILRLNDSWQENPDPRVNGQTKVALTRYLTQIVWDRRGLG
ncbi:MAG: flavin reductase [Anaerolineae bacterium]|nr:MAG: flavin reductase [Anaerolineae bacterium]